jgi:hypothetical protein
MKEKLGERVLLSDRNGNIWPFGRAAKQAEAQEKDIVHYVSMHSPIRSGLHFLSRCISTVAGIYPIRVLLL